MGHSSIEIVKPGMLTSVQDHGRPGWEHLGIPRGGARDFYACIWANRLAANPPEPAVLEATLLGLSVTVTETCWIATTGAQSVLVDGRQYPSWAGFWVEAGSSVALEKLAGARAYLAVHGGLDVESVLGSRSTDLESGFGGYRGRALRAGDSLPIGQTLTPVPSHRTMLRHPSPPVLWYPVQVRAVKGPRDDDFPPEAYERLLAGSYRVSSRSNHIGLRLEGESISSLSRGMRISEPMPIGGVQVTPSGQLVILLNARGTVGGYPVIATVCSIDLWQLGQAKPADEIRFQLVSLEEAQNIRRDAYRNLEQVRPVIEHL